MLAAGIVRPSMHVHTCAVCVDKPLKGRRKQSGQHACSTADIPSCSRCSAYVTVTASRQCRCMKGVIWEQNAVTVKPAASNKV